MAHEKKELQDLLPGKGLKDGKRIFASDSYSVREIAEKLNISTETAQYHLRKRLKNGSKTCL